ILLSHLSTALSSPHALPSNLLTSHAWSAALEKSLAALVGVTVRSTWVELVENLGLEASTSMDVDEAEGPSKKKRKVELPPDATSISSISARLRLLRLFIHAMPSPVPMDLLNDFRKGVVDPALKELAKGRAVEVGIQVAGVRYAMLERVRRDGSEENGWELGKRVKGLRELCGESESAEVVLELAATLLQSLSASMPEEDAHAIFAVILARLEEANESVSWSGHAHGMDNGELAAALWELVSRRWLQTFELFASPEQLAQIATLIVRCMASPSNPHQITINASTSRLLRRADFYEHRRLQSHIHTCLLKRCTIPSLLSPSSVLTSLSASKLPKPLRSLSSDVVNETVETFERISELVPVEYLSKGLRNDLVDRAMAVDVWITAGKLEEGEEEREGKMRVLRSFVLGAAAESPLTDGPAIMSHLVKGTGSSEAVTKVTIAVYRHFVQSSILVYHGDKASAPLEAYLAAFESPLASLAKRFKKNVGPVSCEELALFALADVLSTSLGDYKSTPESLQASIGEFVKAASKPFGKTLSAASAATLTSPASVWDCADLIDGCRRFWQLKDWVSGGECDQGTYSPNRFTPSAMLISLVFPVEAFAAFAQSILGTLVTLTTSSASTLDAQPDSLRTCLAMLDLLGFRIARLRELSDPAKHSTLPFETFLACHLAFRQGLRTVPGASGALLNNLKRATVTSTIREYSAALNGISAYVGQTVTSEDAASQMASLEPALAVALVLLRDGPDGSSRLSTACLTDILRHLSLLLAKVSSSDKAPLQGAALAEALLVISTFLEGICGEQPMLLSRQNVSSVLALVARMLQPSGPQAVAAVSSTFVPSPAALTSQLWISLVTIVDHLVRHRKDHISPLFPHLVATLGPMLSSLRRAGFGTTGSVTIDDGEAGVAVGKRAEREARATFPSWVWEGGARAMGRPEAKAVGRLLASLTAKTASATLKRKHGSMEKDTSTTSLAAPLSKHAPFILLPYLRACVNVVSPIPSVLRTELQGGWFEVMDSMGKWEREALMKGFLTDEEEAERGVLRGMWRTWEKERYRG
ncbi:nucleolar pre-ribosomal-associated protein 2, partial [Phenoliferia sp. Uapishka_3]